VIDGRIYVTDQGRSRWAYAPTAPSTGAGNATTLGLESGRYQVRAVELGVLMLLVLALTVSLEAQARKERARAELRAREHPVSRKPHRPLA
jgi:hypothetical protein